MRKHWWLPLTVLVLGTAALWPLREQLTPAGIAALSPRQSGLTVIFLWALYALKGLSVAFPLTALEAAGGLLFPFPAALAVNLGGVLLAQGAPYLLGRRQRSELTNLADRWPWLVSVDLTQHPGRSVFLLRLAGAAPGDLVSLYLGAAGVSWGAYLAGGLLGSFPRVAASTLLGAALLEAGSPRFFLSLLPGAALTLLSFLLWRRWRHA